ncbi:MAG: DUF1848 domain-containing protein [Veillonellaceae bacterium]|mgnify:CR=1 FL=1|nr:DUF1848 domain-containing protein [Veillonellaceae bacterium]
MILSVSRRTDIPAFYSDWFFKRLKAGYVLVRNPVNFQQVSKVILSPEVIDCIVFWTKNPVPILDKLELLAEYDFYFQITITPYNEKIEANVLAKPAVIEAFKQLSAIIGKERTIWRYDPIILTDELDFEYHSRKFEAIANALQGRTDRCIISFLDLYKKAERNMSNIPLKPINVQLMLEIGGRFKNIASKYGLIIQTCSELVDLSSVGIEHGKCIDDCLIARIIGQELRLDKDKNQRTMCGCAASVDIGAYNTCKHGCLYCYANFSANAVKNNLLKHDPNSPMLSGNLEPGDKVTERKMKSCRTKQLGLF